MTQRLLAVYRNGAFLPQTPCDLPEESQVELVIQGLGVLAPVATDPGEKAQVLRQVVDRMRANPLPVGTPTLSRDELQDVPRYRTEDNGGR